MGVTGQTCRGHACECVSIIHCEHVHVHVDEVGIGEHSAPGFKCHA